MRTIYLITALSMSMQIAARTFTVVNQTDKKMRITWKSNGIGLQKREGTFELEAGATCQSCLESYKNNCVHYLLVETLDNNYKARSKNFCKDSKIVIVWEKTKNWLTRFDTKKLKIILQDLPLKTIGDEV